MNTGGRNLGAVSMLLAAALGGCSFYGSGGYPMHAGARGEYGPGGGAGTALGGAADELWVIARATFPDESVEPDEERPGTGALMARREGAAEGDEVPMPLRHTEVDAAISGYVARVSVVQQYQNPFDEKIEAVYVFPLPSNSAVNEFVMTVGERKIRGIIREREEAERIYEEARAQGYVASLLTQERPNVFTQKVANIEPGQAIDVELLYYQTLEYADGWLEWAFPMVVGPRFNPPGFDGGIGAVGRGDQGISGQATEVSYLRPGERSGHDIGLTVAVDAGVAIEELEVPTHAVSVERPERARALVKLADRAVIPNKDFVLRYRVAGTQIKSGLLTHRDERGGFFTLMAYPPAALADLPRQPMEMVFVLDCSGSMYGQPLELAKDAVRYALGRLGPDDTFQIITFSDDASSFGDEPVPATRRNLERALDYLDDIDSEGGTMMDAGIRAALDFPHDPRRFRIVSFLTDGYIGNELEIFASIRERLGPARIFSFGVGSSVNRYLMEGMARIGRGAVAYVNADDGSQRAVAAFFDRIAHPAMTDVEIDWGGMEVHDVYPSRVPDLFVGRALVLTGRFEGGGRHTVRLSGRAGDRAVSLELDVDLDAAEAAYPGIPFVWARKQIEVLEDRDAGENSPAIAAQIKDLALEYGLMSAYTAFVAVDASRVTEGDHGTVVPVAVPVPEGVRYETTVQEAAEPSTRPRP
ncbi:MAG: VWA domain-containing protein [Myxococcales bacterium]|nr:VWA domain-containing protein [Myxococcales bacterium]